MQKRLYASELAGKIAEESIVLLKNKADCLPLSQGQRIAFFGRTQNSTIISGNGSGASKQDQCKNLIEACEENQIYACKKLAEYYRIKQVQDGKSEADTFDWSNLSGCVNSGLMYEIFGQYHAPKKEYAIPEELVEESAAETHTAILMLGRNSGGEECDRHLYEDYYLTESEKNLICQVEKHFKRIILVLNINGLIDLKWAKESENICSIVFVGIPGQEGMKALADILVGKAVPSGKLAVTIAQDYSDYPSAYHFSFDKDNPESILAYENYGLTVPKEGKAFRKNPVTVYQEDVYLGYRYFDSFGKVPLYAFGQGLSYTQFHVELTDASKYPEGIRAAFLVKNVGKYSGKEVLQMYVTFCGSGNNRPLKKLVAFEKTDLIMPGKEQKVQLSIPYEALAFYQEEKAAYIVEKGNYLFRAGSSSVEVQPVLKLYVTENVVTTQCANRLRMSQESTEKIKLLTSDKKWEEEACDRYMEVTPAEIRQAISKKREEWKNTKASIAEEIKESIKETVASLSVEQLAALCVGYGPGVPFSAFGEGHDPETIYDETGTAVTTNSHKVGVNGYVSPAILEKGICSVFYKDGPAGIGETVWPTEMLMACSFNRKLWYQFGDAAGAECEKQQVDIWLAPAVNLHRHPLGGRNFEYLSEDPFLTGICGVEITKGVEENHKVLVCPKHFAVNEQETYRRGNKKRQYNAVDSMISEHAVRELYLEPFRRLVRDAHISCLMTSFNRINGVFAAGNRDLLTHILREEWGFEGYVVTDWGDMDIVVDGADALLAGNDIIMPGGPPVIAQIMNGFNMGKISREAMERGVYHLLLTIKKCLND